MQIAVGLECLAGGLLALGAPGAIGSPDDEERGASALVRPAEALVRQEDAPPPEEPPLADPQQVERLLERFERARRAKDALAWSDALLAMAQSANEEFVEPALEALDYRASRADKTAARERAGALGERDRDVVERLVHERESAVHVAGARVLVWHAERDVGRALQRAFTRRGMCQEKPVAAAAMVDAMGRTGYRDAQEDVLDELERRGDQELLKACARYFGQVGTTSYDAVRALCRELAAPEPAGVNTAGNPPASYWEERWRKWLYVRRDIAWSLHRITGQSFQPAESGGPGDSRRALEWVEEHQRELGLR